MRRGAVARGARGEGDRAGRPGLDALRPRPRACATASPLCCARLGRIDGIRWIRVMYAYPATMTDAILDAIASEEKVVKYVDIPLQHASESVLKRMKRPTGRGQPAGPRGADARARARRRRPHLVHRRLPGRDRGRVRGAAGLRRRPARSTTSASSRSPTRRARRPSTSPDRVPRGSRRAAGGG